VRPSGSESADLIACSRCQGCYPATATFFVLNKSCRNGLAGWCRTCRREYGRAWRARNQKRLRSKARAYYERVERPKTRARQLARLQRQPHKERAKILRYGILFRARELGLPIDAAHFTITRLTEMLLAQPGCPCCGRLLDVSRKFDGKKNDASPSVDRIIPSQGYVIGNVAILCWRCNNLKRDATADELECVVRWLRSVARGKKP